jgi:hypothetical protein
VGEVHLVKMDVEGFEAEALRGMARLVAASPRIAVILEYKPELWQRRGGAAPLHAALSDLGLRDVQAIRDGAAAQRVDLAAPEPFRGLLKCNLLARRLENER